MPVAERWGQTRTYPRDWPAYNEELVMRGTFYVATDFVETQEGELAAMNRRKRGRPFEYANSQIRFEALLHTWLDYRSIEGFVRRLADHVPGLRVNDYTTICRRYNRLDLCLEPPASLDGHDVIVDATGIKVTNRGEWIRHKWRTARGWIKVSVAIERKNKRLLDIQMEEEVVPDGDLAERHLETFEKGQVKGFWMDGAGYRRSIFRKLQELGALPVIKIPKPASIHGFDPMHTAAREFKKLGYEAWRDKYAYGDRWHVEGFFSAFKRYCGETVRATKKENMFHETWVRLVLFDQLRVQARAIAGN